MSLYLSYKNICRHNHSYITTFDQKLAELLNNWQVEGWPVGNLVLVLIALLLSVILCGIIGIEREWRGRSAGLRTHLLVGVGSCVIMIISIYGFPALFGEKRDVARLAAQIITGVGFLGAGAIIHKNDGIKGLTTAGTIWIVMAIGVACGSFNFIIAILTTVVIIVVLTIFKKVEAKLTSKKLVIVVTAPADKPVLAKVLSYSEEFDCTINTLSTDLVNKNGVNMIQFTLLIVFNSEKVQTTDFITRLSQNTDAIDIHTISDHR